MKFVHAADIHLDSPLVGLERYEGAPVAELRGATRKALENLVQLSIDEAVDLVLIAGDVFDGDWKDYNTGLFFARQMVRLRDARIPVVLIRGNHDAASQITRSLRLPDNVRELAADQPQTIRLEAVGVAIHGQSFPTVAVTDNLAARYPSRQPGCFNIGLLHTSAGGREGHENYAPCSVSDLAAKGYDYWALGHVHAREIVARDPWIVFPGNLQGRHARETGAKGCTLVEVAAGSVRAVEHRPLDVVRWQQCTIDAGRAENASDLLDATEAAFSAAVAEVGDRLLAVRLVYEGATRAHHWLAKHAEQFGNECRRHANDAGRERLWVEKIVLRTRAAVDVEALARRTDPVGELLRYLRNLPDDPSALAAVLKPLKECWQKLPIELREGPEALDWDDPAAVRALLHDAEQTLLPLLWEQEPER
jgi:DNA repair exonuclease SbcCD nuclease subunit